jgi:hypothetical protein
LIPLNFETCFQAAHYHGNDCHTDFDEVFMTFNLGTERGMSIENRMVITHWKSSLLEAYRHEASDTQGDD